MDSISKTVKEKMQTTVNRITVNSKKKNIITVNSKVNELLEELQLEPEALAQVLADKLNDQKNIDYYILLAKNAIPTKLFEAVSITLDAERRGKIRVRKPVYFLGILRRWNIQTKFTSKR